MWPLLPAIDFRGDDDGRAQVAGMGNNGGTVVSPVSDDDLGSALAEQIEGLGIVAALSGGEAELERLALAVDQQMHLGCQTSSASPQSLVAPFLRPVAAC